VIVATKWIAATEFATITAGQPAGRHEEDVEP